MHRQLEKSTQEVGENRAMKKTIVLRGPVLSQSGYGVHCRQIANWLLSKNDVTVKFHVLPWGDTPWYINPSDLNGLVGKIMENTVEQSFRGDISLQLQLPNEWDNNVAKINIGLTAGVETDKCNPAWLHKINLMDRLIVPSNHALQCFKNTGEIKIPFRVIPESFVDGLENIESNEMHDLQFSTNFNFLIFGQLTGNNAFNDRKNTFFTIKWLCETFKNDKDVGIVIKTNTGRNTKLDRKNVKAIFEKLISECRQGPFPKIHLLHGELSEKEVCSLYKHPQIKALISATRGEGYGLPTLEAAASGLPVIATNWSGHLDFLKKGRFIDLDYDLLELHSSRIDDKIFMKGAKWANPKEEDFKKKVLKFRNSNQVPKEWAENLKNKLLKEYSSSQVFNYYDEFLGDIIS